ncbi:hypothetical protein [Photobacterium damselae]|uniref:hypothetical protein n=1 Tax=Photobacterium damselae TaxID=38293 RepID=UPI002543C5F7
MCNKITQLGRSHNTERTLPKTHLKASEQRRISKAIDNHTYELDNGRAVMDVTGIREALKMRPESVEHFISNCSNADKVIIDGKIFVYQSVVYRKSFDMNEQPYTINKRHYIRYGRDLLVNQLRK